MKIVLTGATGFVGSNILAHLLDDPRISGVTCISRRPIGISAPKITAILQKDFLSYDSALLNQLADHHACIWALGGKASALGSLEVFTRVTHGFTLALAKGVAVRAKQRFTFCYLSGMGADQTEAARLPWEKQTRHLKGRTEKDLHVLQERNASFCSHAFRPGCILPDDTNKLLRLALAPIAIEVGELAGAMIAGAVDSHLFRQWPVISNRHIKCLARGLPLE